MGYSPENSLSNSPREWMPFIEAFAHVGRWKEAAEISLMIVEKGKEFLPKLTSLWQELGVIFNNGPVKQATLNEVHHSFH